MVSSAGRPQHAVPGDLSGACQDPTHAVQQAALYSINSFARSRKPLGLPDEREPVGPVIARTGE